MEVVHPKWAGLDVHQQTVVACARVVAGSSVTHAVRTFGTTTQELLALSDWLSAHGCTHVAMESTGVYWKPVWHVLEESVELVLANAMHIRNIPGRKSGVNDATWIADLLAHGSSGEASCPPPRSRSCAISPGPASSSCARSRNTPFGSRRPWRPRTSS